MGSFKTAAEQGNINKLYDLIRGNPKALEDIDKVPFIETPLHVAASCGKISFAMEIVRLKPSFSRKLNEGGFSPMHLALLNGQTKMVLRFVDHESDLVRVQGKEGKTPLHHVAEEGDADLLAKLLWACPTSIEDVTVHGETALHIAVKNRKVKALDVLLGGLLTACSGIQKKSIIINRKDVQGKTALHIAIATNQVQVVKLLVKSGIDVNAKDDDGKTALHIATATDQLEVVKLLVKSGIDVNAKDDEGKTALDSATNHTQVKEILFPQAKNIAKALKCCLRWFPNRRTDGRKYYLMSNLSLKDRLYFGFIGTRKHMDNDTRNILLVVATLILTATYQSALSPPGGLWQDNSKSNNTSTNIHYNNHNDGGSGTPKSETHRAGSTIMPSDDFLAFYVSNTLTLLVTTLVIFFLLPRDHMRWLLYIPLYFFSACYMSSWLTISPVHMSAYVLLAIWLLVIAVACFCSWLLFKYSREFDQTTTSSYHIA